MWRFFLWRVEFFKIGKGDFTFSREMRVYFTFDLEILKDNDAVYLVETFIAI